MRSIRWKTHGVGALGALVGAVLLCFLWRAWPFRLLYVDLLLADHHIIPQSDEYSTRMLLSFDVVLAANFILLFLSFELVRSLMSLSVSKKFPRLGLATSLAIAAGIILSLFCLYPAAKDAVLFHQVTHAPSKVTIFYAARAGIGPQPTSWIISSEGGGAHEPGAERLFPFDAVKADVKKITVPEWKMLELLRLLREGDFFKMEASLYLRGTIDGCWQGIEVSDGTFTHRVVSYSPESESFEALVERLLRGAGAEED